MKTNKFFALAAIACGFAVSFTSCNKEDNPVVNKQAFTISFEKKQLNANSFWCGEVGDNGVANEWGGFVYPCVYQEEGVTFPVTYGGYYWSGFALSSRTESGFTFGDYTPEGMPDQFNNITGKAHNGSNFLVVQTYGEVIDFGGAVNLKGFWYTNSSYTVDAILNGDGMSPGKFEANDFLTCVVYPEPAANILSGARYEIPLAKDGDYVKEWKYCDLSDVDAFKNIKSISFGFEGSKSNDWGLTTPTYICIDDMDIER